MGIAQSQVAIAVLFSVGFMVTIYRLGRTGKLSFRYTIGWLLLGISAVTAGFMIPIAGTFAESIPLSPAAFFVWLAVLTLAIIAVQLSISISGMQEQIRTLAEEIALLQHKTEENQLKSDWENDD